MQYSIIVNLPKTNNRPVQQRRLMVKRSSEKGYEQSIAALSILCLDDDNKLLIGINHACEFFQCLSDHIP